MQTTILKFGMVVLYTLLLTACAPNNYNDGLYPNGQSIDYGTMNTNHSMSSSSPSSMSGALSMSPNCMCNPPRQMMSVQSVPSVARGTVFNLGGVLFEFNRAKLLPNGWQVVQAVAKHLHNNPSYRALVEGHTDNFGSESYNMRLSRQRAESVQNALVSLGISPTRVDIAYYGERRPVADNKTDAGRQMNRRVQITLQ